MDNIHSDHIQGSSMNLCIFSFSDAQLSLQDFRQAANPLQKQTSLALELCGHRFKTPTNLQSLKGD